MRIQRLSWAGIKVELGSTTLFVDAAMAEAGDVPLESGTPNCNAVVTHHHSDHYDLKALQSVFNTGSLLICHQDVYPWLAPPAGAVRIQMVSHYQPLLLSRGSGEIVVTAVPAVDGFGHPQVSWVIDGGGKRILHCGDTLWHGHWWDIGRVYGPFDIAFLPINGARQVSGRFIDSGFPMVLTPEQAASAGALLGAKRVCPIHYGRHEPPIYLEVPEPESSFQAAAQKRETPVLSILPGEWVDV
jgi:L-ascorbate metabolism protein UlaG (beta-lactamase superfamily)